MSFHDKQKSCDRPHGAQDKTRKEKARAVVHPVGEDLCLRHLELSLTCFVSASFLPDLIRHAISSLGKSGTTITFRASSSGVAKQIRRSKEGRGKNSNQDISSAQRRDDCIVSSKVHARLALPHRHLMFPSRAVIQQQEQTLGGSSQCRIQGGKEHSNGTAPQRPVRTWRTSVYE
ncbi:hypothetical protein DL98DRAFT_632641 [Cadophora sp. DSE1049]|nr:hypothetical protein DL98DRAFT_632641 [Cadophora sp. DSE1049]